MKRFSANMPTALVAICIFVCSLLISTGSNGQTKYQSNGGVKLTIEGTSNIHDWDMKSNKGACTAEFKFNSTGQLTGLTTLHFSVPAESLKSEHKSMDKNTYKALNTDKYNAISFTASNAVAQPNGKGGYVLTARGNLTISGVTRVVDLTATGTMNPDKTITYTGSYKLKMTDYKVTPPTMMFGAIKTGDAITVKFDLVLQAL
jgi:polyisoprenoid-binding protein YceI